MTDPLREAISVSLTARREETDLAQNPPRAALPDVAINVGAELPEATATSRILREDRPSVVLEIPSSIQEPSEPRQWPDTLGKWFQPTARGHKRPRTTSPPSPRHHRMRSSSAGSWCE